MSRHTAFIALGSNLGDRVSHLHAALRLMGNASTSRAMAKHKWDGTERSGDDMTVLATSHLYSTPPMYYTQQPSFLNAVCKVSTQLDPLTLLRRLQSIESAVGRTKSFQNGPRVVDLDILLYDNQIISHKKDNEHLEIPHPRMHSRGFTLLPLCDIAADLEHPAMKRPMASLLQSLSANDLEDIKRVSVILDGVVMILIASVEGLAFDAVGGLVRRSCGSHFRAKRFNQSATNSRSVEHDSGQFL